MHSRTCPLGSTDVPVAGRDTTAACHLRKTTNDGRGIASVIHRRLPTDDHRCPVPERGWSRPTGSGTADSEGAMYRGKARGAAVVHDDTRPARADGRPAGIGWWVRSTSLSCAPLDNRSFAHVCQNMCGCHVIEPGLETTPQQHDGHGVTTQPPTTRTARSGREERPGDAGTRNHARPRAARPTDRRRAGPRQASPSVRGAPLEQQNLRSAISLTRRVASLRPSSRSRCRDHASTWLRWIRSTSTPGCADCIHDANCRTALRYTTRVPSETVPSVRSHSAARSRRSSTALCSFVSFRANERRAEPPGCPLP